MQLSRVLFHKTSADHNMINHGAKWYHGFAVGTWATHQPPFAHLLVLLDLIIWDFHIAALELTLMQGLLDNSQGKEARSLTHGNPTGGAAAGQRSLPSRVSISDEFKVQTGSQKRSFGY